jgi:hypothetical protein
MGSRWMGALMLAGCVGDEVSPAVAPVQEVERAIVFSDGHAAPVPVPRAQATLEDARVLLSPTTAAPSDWPSDIPIYSGGSVTAAGSGTAHGRPFRSVVFDSADGPAKILAFYRSQFPLLTPVIDNQAPPWMAQWVFADGRRLTVAAFPAEGRTTVNVTVDS